MSRFFLDTPSSPPAKGESAQREGVFTIPLQLKICNSFYNSIAKKTPPAFGHLPFTGEELWGVALNV